MKKLLLLASFLPLLGFGQNNAHFATQNSCGCSCHNFVMAQRSDRTSSVFEISGQLSQCGVAIGTCTTEDTEIDNEDVQFIQYFLPNGTLAAEATVYEDQQTAEIFTYKDHRSRTIQLEFTSFVEDDIAEWLAARFYL